MAAGVVLGYLKYVLGFDSIAFRKGMSDAERELIAKQKSFIKQGEKLQSLGKSMAAFVSLPLAGLAAKGIQEARETAEAMAQVNAALASMGPVADRSSEQLKKAADAFEGSSLFEADEILKKVTANMLTFGNVSGAAFDRAQQAAIDLATRMGTDLQSATVLVGKALNDPITGLSSLTRVGIQFTEQQKEQIKAMTEAGNVAGAQKIILGELERQFGGAAQAAQNADPFNKLSDAFKQMAETIGTALLPIIPPLTDAVTSVLNAFSSLSPETQKWILIAGGIVAVVGPVIGVIGSLMTVLGPMLPLILKLGPAWVALKTVLLAMGPVLTAVRVAALALLGNPVLLGAAAVIAGIYLAWKNWDKIVAIVQRVYSAVKTWIMDKLNAVFTWVKDKVQSVGDKFKWLYDAVVGHSYIPDMVLGIGQWMGRLNPLMVEPARAAANATADVFKDVAQLIGETNEEIVVSAERTAADTIEAFGQMAEGVVGSMRDLVGQLKGGDILGALQSVLDIVKNVVGTLGSLGIIKVGGTGGATPRAHGGPVVPGRTYLVGENGPEYLRFGSRGYISPPKDGGGLRIQVVKGDLFDVIVDRRAGAIAAPMAGHAAVAGATGGMAGMARRQSRTLP